MLSEDLQKLKNLERQKKISIGVHRNKANNYRTFAFELKSQV